MDHAYLLSTSILGAFKTLGLIVFPFLIILRFSNKIIPISGTIERFTTSYLLFLAFIRIVGGGLVHIGVYGNEHISTLISIISILIYYKYHQFNSFPQILKDKFTRSTYITVIMTMAAWVYGGLTLQKFLEPPIDYDGLRYRLPHAGFLLQEGEKVFPEFPGLQFLYETYPWAGELIYSWMMWPFMGDQLLWLFSLATLLWCACSLFVLLQQLNCSTEQSIAWALLFIAIPTMQVVYRNCGLEILSTALVLQSLSFTLRYRDKGRTRDLWAICLIISLGISIRQINILPSGILLTYVILLFFKNCSGKTPSKNFFIAASSLLIIVFLGAGQYLDNYLTHNNPFYPYGIKLMGMDIFPGSGYFNQQTGDPSKDWETFIHFFQYYPTYFFTAPGPKFLFIFSFSFIPSIYFFFKKDWRNFLLFSLMFLIVFIPFIQLFATQSESFQYTRRLYTIDIYRYLLPSIAIAIIIVASFTRSKTWFKWPLFISIIFDFSLSYQKKSSLIHHDLWWTTLIILSLCFLFILKKRSSYEKWSFPIIVVSLLGFFTFYNYQVQPFKRSLYHNNFFKEKALYKYHHLVTYLDSINNGQRIGIYLKDCESITGFYYLFMGTNLQHKPEYVCIDSQEEHSSHSHHLTRRKFPHKGSWLNRATDIDIFIFDHDNKIESKWIHELSQEYTLDPQVDQEFKVYRKK
jgi:hypothetical protein